MRKRLNNLLVLLCALSLTALVAVSCSDSSTGTGGNTSQLEVHTENSLAAVGVGRGGIGAGDYTLYSLRENKVVPASPEDSASTKWDIGFSGAQIIVNNTVSGPGNAAAYVAYKPFDQVTQVKMDSLTTDTDAEP